MLRNCSCTVHVLVRHVNPVSGTIVINHLDTICITVFTWLGIFTAVKSILDKYEISIEKMLSLSFTSDTCNVMKEARKVVITHMYTCVILISCTCYYFISFP